MDFFPREIQETTNDDYTVEPAAESLDKTLGKILRAVVQVSPHQGADELHRSIDPVDGLYTSFKDTSSMPKTAKRFYTAAGKGMPSSTYTKA